jgi:predicted nucleic acid-binding protein
LLAERFKQFIATAFETRTLPFDESAARLYGEIKGYRREIGRPLSDLDGQIACIARSMGFAVATRNIKDFTDFGIELINPFEFSG